MIARIRRGAPGRGLPRRDLRVSRQHRLWLDGRLIAAASLVGRPGIARDDRCVPLTYRHLLCDSHEFLFAEGAPAESLLRAPEGQPGFRPVASADDGAARAGAR
jgi:hypothetical protein